MGENDGVSVDVGCRGMGAGQGVGWFVARRRICAILM